MNGRYDETIFLLHDLARWKTTSIFGCGKTKIVCKNCCYYYHMFPSECKLQIDHMSKFLISLFLICFKIPNSSCKLIFLMHVSLKTLNLKCVFHTSF